MELRIERTVMGDPVLRTRWPRTRPSVPSMAMVRTMSLFTVEHLLNIKVLFHQIRYKISKMR
jgi:hypothetical protein